MKSFVKLTPVLVLAALMIAGFDALIAAPLACLYAVIVAYITEKVKVSESIDVAVENVKQIQLVFFILMFAYAMAEAFMQTGVGAAVVNLALKLGLTGRTVASVGMLVTAILSVATGTSWGTFAACAPIFLWLNHIVGGDLLLTTASIAGGACFGDNIGLISDTTVVSSGIQRVEIVHRIRHQGAWSLFCLILSIVIVFVLSTLKGLPTEVGSVQAAIDSIPPEAYAYMEEEKPAAITLLNQISSGVPYYMVIPLVLVIGVAIKGLPTLLCLGLGVLSAYLLGLVAGTVESTKAYLEMVTSSFADAGSWVIVMMMWVSAFGGIMSRIAAFEPVSNFMLKISANVRQLMTYNAIFCLLGNAALSDEMAQIVTIGPIISELVDENVEGSEKDMYTLHLRNATFSDAMGVFGSQLIPWHVYIGFYISMASAVYPLHEFQPFDIIKFNVMAMVAVISMIVLTFTGLDRFIPMFKMPAEPDVRLVKK